MSELNGSKVLEGDSNEFGNTLRLSAGLIKSF